MRKIMNIMLMAICIAVIGLVGCNMNDDNGDNSSGSCPSSDSDRSVIGRWLGNVDDVSAGTVEEELGFNGVLLVRETGGDDPVTCSYSALNGVIRTCGCQQPGDSNVTVRYLVSGNTLTLHHPGGAVTYMRQQ